MPYSIRHRNLDKQRTVRLPREPGPIMNAVYGVIGLAAMGGYVIWQRLTRL
jgi:hypothetical protein